MESAAGEIDGKSHEVALIGTDLQRPAHDPVVFPKIRFLAEFHFLPASTILVIMGPFSMYLKG